MAENRKKQEPKPTGDSHYGIKSHLGIAVLDFARFVLTFVVFTLLWMTLMICPECGQHHLGHGNFTPVLLGLLTAFLFLGLRYLYRRKNKT